MSLIRVRKYIAQFLVLVFGLSFSAQAGGYKDQIDSLFTQLENFSGPDTSKAYIDLLIELGNTFYDAEKHQESQQYYESALEQAEKANLQELIPVLKIYLGETNFRLADYTSAFEYTLEGLNTGYPHLSLLDSSYALSLLGSLNFYTGNPSAAYEYYYKAYDIAQQLNDTLLMAEFHYAKGQLDADQEKYFSAFEHFLSAKNIYQKLGDHSGISDCLASIGDVYHLQNDYRKALDYKTQAYQIDSSLGYVYGIAYCFYSLAETYVEFKNYQRALELLKKSLALREELGDNEEITLTQAAIGRVKSLTGKSREGITDLKRSLAKAEELNILPLQLEILDYLQEAHRETGDFRSALTYQDAYYAINDSIYNQASLNRIASVKANFDYKAVKKELELQKKEQEILLLEQRGQLDNYRKWLFLFMACCLALVAGFIFIMYERANEHKKELEKKAVLISEKNEALSESNQKLTAAVKAVSKANLQLSSTNEKLTKANKELEQFSYISSHDLKTPLRMVGSFSSLLARRYSKKLDKNADEFIEYIVDGVKQMYTMLDDIYNYSRASADTSSKQPVDLNNIAQNLMHKFLLFSNNVHTEIQIGQLPVVMGNKIQLKQVFQNLIDNAFKYLSKDRPPVIEIYSKPVDDETWQITISDNGIGIDPAHQEKIFTLFKKLHHTGMYEGTGVGLAICKKIIENHDGRIWVESEFGTGTKFHFTLKSAKSEELEKLGLIEWPFVPAENL